MKKYHKNKNKTYNNSKFSKSFNAHFFRVHHASVSKSLEIPVTVGALQFIFYSLGAARFL